MAVNRINDTLVVWAVGGAARHASVTNRVDRELNLFVISVHLFTIDVFLSPLDRHLRDKSGSQRSCAFDEIRAILYPRSIGSLLAR